MTWWKGRCAVIADETNLMANPDQGHTVTPWMVEQVLITAENVRKREHGGRALPEVMEDEDGTMYFASGHVDPVLFVFACAMNLMCDVGMDTCREFLTQPDGTSGHYRKSSVDELVGDVEYKWYRYDRLPDDDEHMAVCAAGDEGAIPFTVLGH